MVTEFGWWAFTDQQRFAQQCVHERDRLHRERVCQYHIDRVFSFVPTLGLVSFVPTLGVVMQRKFNLPASLFVYILSYVGNEIGVQ